MKKWVSIFFSNSDAFLLPQRIFCIHNGKKKAKIGYCLSKPCTFRFFNIRSPVFVLFHEDILENVKKKRLQSGSLREGRSGYSNTYLFFRLVKVTHCVMATPKQPSTVEKNLMKFSLLHVPRPNKENLCLGNKSEKFR